MALVIVSKVGQRASLVAAVFDRGGCRLSGPASPPPVVSSSDVRRGRGGRDAPEASAGGEADPDGTRETTRRCADTVGGDGESDLGPTRLGWCSGNGSGHEDPTNAANVRDRCTCGSSTSPAGRSWSTRHRVLREAKVVTGVDDHSRFGVTRPSSSAAGTARP